MKRSLEHRLAKLRPGVAQKLGFYVYAYVDPRTEKIIYVGKGQDDRVLSHMSGASNKHLAACIEELAKLNLEARIDVLAHGLRDEAEATAIEAAVIDAVGIDHLTNAVRGGGTVTRGRSSLRELDLRYGASPTTISDAAILIRINKLYLRGMTDDALYEATRGVWKIDPDRARRAKYALAVFGGVVYGVFEVIEWHRAASTPYRTRTLDDVSVPGRWEFTGHRAAPQVWQRYVGYSVTTYFPKGLQNPIRYVNI